MENQRNFVQQAVKNNDILPIEREMIDFVASEIENATGKKTKIKEKISTEVFYDSYSALSEKDRLIVKINLSPELPNFWRELCDTSFSFHPKIVCSSKESDYKFICFEEPSGCLLSDISSRPLNLKLNFIQGFTTVLKSLHQTKVRDSDNTIKAFDAFCPMEASMISRTFPLTNFLGTLKIIFRQHYKESLEDCGLCHFDLSPQNVSYSGKDFKFLNFEYADFGNIYIDFWLLKETMNISDQAFLHLLDLYGVNKNKIYAYKESSELFIFSYFNSKIIAEYMTFGVRDPIKLKYWINKSEIFYEKIKAKLFFEKKLDNAVREFYYLWK